MKAIIKDTLLMAVMVTVLVGAGFFSAGAAIMKGNVFLEGSTINGIDISGMEPEEAEQAVLEQERARAVPVSLQLLCEGQALQLNDENTGRTTNAEKQIHDYLFNLYDGTAGEKYDTLLAFRKNVIVEYTSEYDLETIRRTIAGFAALFEQPAADASIQIDESGPQYVPGSEGRYLDVDETAALVHEVLLEGEAGGLELRLKVQEPSVTVEELREQVGQIGYCATSINREGEIQNIDTMLEQLNGQVIQPDALLSLNELTGQRGEHNGYTAIVPDSTDILDKYGSGVSQVAGTLYYAALLADMEVVERNAQSVPTAYARPGLDAIIDIESGKDLILKNVSDMPLYIFAQRKGSELEVSIYGKPVREGCSIKVETEVLEWIPPGEPEYIFDEEMAEADVELESDAREGANVIVNRCYYSDDEGALLDKKRISLDSYQPVKAKYRTGDSLLAGK